MVTKSLRNTTEAEHGDTARQILHPYANHKNHCMFALVFLLLGLLPLQSDAGVALLYHHVDSTTPPITSISPVQFERHLDILAEEGFRIVTLDELLKLSKTGDPSEKIVAITFDDAYRSIYETAFPLLKARSWPFTIFVATDFVTQSSKLYLSWSELREMSEHGAHIAGHTTDHSHLIRRNAEESHHDWQQRVRKTISSATQTLSKQGFDSTHFAYPYGEYNLELLDIVAEMGLNGFGQQSGAIGPDSHPQLYPRFPLAGIYVGEDAFRDKIRSLPLPVTHPMIEPLVEDDLRPTLTLSFIDPDFDASRMQCYGPGGLIPIAEGPQDALMIKPNQPVSTGRSRYNCTLAAGGRRFYWFSQLWIRKLADGSWYAEP